jgi:hypothetical protein
LFLRSVINSNSLALRLGPKSRISISLVPVREKSAGGQVVGVGWKRDEACEEERMDDDALMLPLLEPSLDVYGIRSTE